MMTASKNPENITVQPVSAIVLSTSSHMAQNPGSKLQPFLPKCGLSNQVQIICQYRMSKER